MAGIAILIVSWNCKESLHECLSSLSRNAPSGIDIIVVDNASPDSTAGMVREEFPDTILSVQSENLGFAKANNLALSMTNAEYLLILNPDTRIYPGTIEALSDYLDQYPKAGLASPQIVDKSGVIVPSVFRFPSIWNYWTEHSLFLNLIKRLRRSLKPKHPHTGFPSKPEEIEWATGAAFMVRRAALEGQPLFDERFFLYSEDVDLCLRLKKGGWKRYLIPTSRVCHMHRQSSRKSPVFTIIHLFRSMDLYFEKNTGSVRRFVLRLFICIDMILRLILIRIYPGKETFRVENIHRKKAYKEIIRVLNPFHPGRDTGLNK
jgi:hypothetical protein